MHQHLKNTLGSSYIHRVLLTTPDIIDDGISKSAVFFLKFSELKTGILSLFHMKSVTMATKRETSDYTVFFSALGHMKFIHKILAKSVSVHFQPLFKFFWCSQRIALNIYFYLFLYLYITRITINNGTPHLK